MRTSGRSASRRSQTSSGGWWTFSRKRCSTSGREMRSSARTKWTPVKQADEQDPSAALARSLLPVAYNRIRLSRRSLAALHLDLLNRPAGFIALTRRRPLMTEPAARAVATPKPRRDLDRAVVRFAGDSGDGMQLTGEQFTIEAAVAGSDIATLPNFPAEIRAPAGTLFGVSSFQPQFGSQRVYTPGDRLDCLVAMNPAAL